MAKLLKLRRGTTSQHSSFTGAEGEVTVDTDKETLVVHNGSTAGGFPVMSASGGTFTGAVTFNSTVNYEGDLDLQDGDKLLLGTGDDLQIFHDGSDSYIKDTGTGQLLLQTDSFRIHNAAANELQIAADENSDVELYFNGVKKFNTSADGATMTGRLSPAADDSYGLGQSSLRFANLFLSGDIDMNDNDKIKLGTGNDLQIYHSNDNNSYIHEAGSGHLVIKADDLYIQNSTGSQTNIKSASGAAVELSHAGTKKLETTATGISVTGKVEISDDLNLTGGSYNALWDKSANTFKFNDNARIALGNDSDCAMHHDGGSTWILNNTGHFYIRNNVDNDDGSNIYIQPKSGEGGIAAIHDGEIKLYYDGSVKFETNSQGTRFYGRAYFDDNMKIEMGAAADLKICHDGTNTTYISTTGDNYFKAAGNTYLRVAGDENALVAVANAEVALYHNEAKKFETTSTGVKVDNYITLGGTGGFRSDNAIIIEDAGGNEWRAKFHDNAQCEFAYDNSLKFETLSGGAKVHGALTVTDALNLNVHDNQKIKLGASNDLDLYHDGSNSYIRNSAGIFHIRGNDLRLEAYSGERYMDCTENSAVALYHNNSKKFETTSSGVTVTGTITATGGGLGGLYDAHAFIEDRKSAGTNGGTFSSGAWRHRDLNTEVYDPDGIVSISSNNFALAGSSSDKYRVYFIAPAYKVDVHQARLYCTTNSSVITYGMATVSKGNAPVTSESMGEARCDGGKTYRIEHYSWQTINGEGFGSTWEANWCQGRFTQIQIQREAS